MTFTDLLPFVGLGVAMCAALSWIIRAQISMSKQFTPNGGASFRDALDRVERCLAETRTEVKELRTKGEERDERLINSIGKVHGRLDEHVRDHLIAKEK